MVVLLEAAVLLGAAGLCYYVILRLLTRAEGRSATRTGRWLAAHYDVDGTTRVVLEKVASPDRRVLDEHLVAAIPIDDAEYDAKFLAAMAVARERRALFEAEEG